MTRTAPPRARPSRMRWVLLIAVLVAVAVAGYLAWETFFGGQAPEGASIEDAAGVLQSASPAASAGASPSVAGSAPPAGSDAPTGSAAADGVDGQWTIDADVGDFTDYTSAWAGFRVDEVLGQGIGETTAIGRTPFVAGELTIEDETLTAASIRVDLTTITSDRPRRDDAIQRALGTSEHPQATFTLTQPVELGGVPADGETVTVEAIGDLAIHGQTRPVVFPLEARLVGERIVVVGAMDVAFGDYGVEMPSAPIVVSVEDTGVLEVQLFFRRA